MKDRLETEIVQAIEAHWVKHGYAPSFRDVAGQIGCSTSTLMGRLVRLRVEGKVDWERGKSRSLRLRQ